MLNNKEFIKRLQIIMDYYELSAALFAEKIAVQRSSISHLLSGRNKPSLEFVLKIVDTFSDEVDMYWLLKGIGSFPKKNDDFIPSPPVKLETVKKTPELKSQAPTIIPNVTSDKEIERVLLFFKDGTFKNYDA